MLCSDAFTPSSSSQRELLVACRAYEDALRPGRTSVVSCRAHELTPPSLSGSCFALVRPFSTSASHHVRISAVVLTLRIEGEVYVSSVFVPLRI